MLTKKYIFVLLALLVAGAMTLFFCAGKGTGVSSPDGNISVNFYLMDKVPYYSVSYKGKTILQDSKLGIDFSEGGILGENLQILDIKKESVDNTYSPVYGKKKEIRNYYNQVTVSLQEQQTPNRLFDIVFRAYNDGIGFRYILPEQESLREFSIKLENSQFRFTDPHITYALQLDSYTTSQESEFNKISLAEIKEDTLVGLPLLVEIKEGPYVAITEANLTDYAGMYLSGVNGLSNTLVSTLSPLPGEEEIKVKAATPHSTPWRVIMIAQEPGKLIESNIILNFNDPCAIEDLSWIKPGKTAWNWWSGSVAKGVKFKSGMNTETMLHYIDFAGDYNLEYMLIDAGWYQRPRRGGSGTSDITKPIKEINIKRILDHAKNKGVDILLWLDWQSVDRQMDEAFPLYEKWGVKGVKVDYMDRDDQEMVNYYHKVVKKAAEHHLIVDFHGAYKPTGIRRTYPNLITREGVMGLEYSKWSSRCDPEHELTIPFTRMLAGPMDFTPGGFRNTTKEQFKAVRGVEPMAQGTRCHQLAMYVVYESPLQMLVDYPSAYRNQTGIEFLMVVPITWDDTKVLNAKVGDYITMARKYGNEWYVGSMTDWTPRKLTASMDFLEKGEYVAEIYQDAPDADKVATNATTKKVIVTSSDNIVINMAPGGGFAMRLSPAPQGSSIKRYKPEV